jgi:outer membrane receptor protein involved in Fe transport
MKYPVLVGILLFASVVASAQTESARISGQVTDPTDAVIAGVECKITNLETNVSTITTTNQDGIYVIADLRPATYRLTIQKEGFRTVVQPSLQLYVQDAVNENFKLALGSVAETSIVTAPLLRTDSAAVSTVVDQQVVSNMPLNGRSFQSLIALTPGVVFTSQNLGQGQFSVNGQFTDTNYFMVDGVSANFGVTIVGLGQTLGGAIPAFTAQGGTNGLVSVDAMQEFRIQTSSYAAEYGRTPGAQISIVTKSGTNQFHGTAFNYLRNDIFDARNYFDAPPLPKPPLRQNDFGGTFGGPILKDKTFVFFSYEGLRLRQPQTATGTFYTASARAAVAPVYQPILNALPLPDANAPLVDPTCDNFTNPCMANLTVAYSNPSSLNATSIRVDHHLTSKITLFARYNHAPSYDAVRNWQELAYDHVNTDTFTAGATILLSPTKVNDFRANWSRNTGNFIVDLTNFHGAVGPPTSVLFPPSSFYNFNEGEALIYFGNQEVREGTQRDSVQRQLNFVDTFSWAAGEHQFKFGIDYRRLSPTAVEGTGYGIFPAGYAALVAGTMSSIDLEASTPFSVNANNYSLFAQDTWRATRHLTVTYGLRWEINAPPVSATAGQPLYVLQGIFDSKPVAAVPGAIWHTRFDGLAPRIGAAYQLTSRTVVRGGFGLFYDLGYGDTGFAAFAFPYLRFTFPSIPSGLPFDLTNPIFQPPPFTTKINSGVFYLNAVDPNLRVPFTMQWNAAIERELGAKQTLTATYVGSDGRRLLRQDGISPPEVVSLGLLAVSATRNAGYSHYEAFQLQFQRRMSHGLQALLSYNLAKSSDLGSDDTGGLSANSVSAIVLPPLTPSDYDIRQSIAGAGSYQVPAPSWGRVGSAILKGWAVDGLVRVTTAPPINVTVHGFAAAVGYYTTQADIVAGHPDWIVDSTQPSGRALNPAAFTAPPVGQTGNLPRNGLRSPYSIDQTDLALRRRFNLTERVKLDVRAEYFNVFNHPMFGLPGSQCNPDSEWTTSGSTPDPAFGKVCPGTSTTNIEAGGGNPGGSGQSPLYATGGPRSAQFTLKLLF